MIIGITGLAGSGKDTAAWMLAEFTGKPVTAFAKPLHDAARHTFGDDCLERENKEREYPFGLGTFEWFHEWHVGFFNRVNNQFNVINLENHKDATFFQGVFSDENSILPTISPRRFMQLYGTEYWRKISPSIFVDIVQANYNDHIVSDVRFANEAEICDVLIVVRRQTVQAVSQHVSEEFASNFDMYADGQDCVLFVDDKPIAVICVDNNGTKQDLRNKIGKIAKKNLRN